MAKHPMKFLKRLPLVGRMALAAAKVVRRGTFPGSAGYWDARYLKGGNSGPGSYGRLAEFKATVINDLVSVNSIRSVIEFGCGDGSQLELANYSNYIGFDVSANAVDICRTRFFDRPAYEFALVSDYQGQTAELSLSLDVIYHLVEDKIFHAYMELLFDSSNKLVLVYSPDAQMQEMNTAHVKLRRFSDWIQQNRPNWKLITHIANRFPYDVENPSETSFSDFYLYRRQ